jgi:hypothetical protein
MDGRPPALSSAVVVCSEQLCLGFDWRGKAKFGATISLGLRAFDPRGIVKFRGSRDVAPG